MQSIYYMGKKLGLGFGATSKFQVVIVLLKWEIYLRLAYFRKYVTFPNVFDPAFSVTQL